MDKLESYHRRLVQQGPQDLFEQILFGLLVPFGLLYGVICWIRRLCYELEIISSYRAAVPVISVGNLAVGGTGKTPVVDLLLKEFLKRGLNPAVVSRGYGGTFGGQVGVVSPGNGPNLSVAEAGDEAFLLARRNPGALVLIARKRSAGVAHAVDTLSADLIILDDGFQHLAVKRDLDLVLLDAKRPLGNGLPLPAGILRELPYALKRADLLLLTRSNKTSAAAIFNQPVYCSQHQLAAQVVSLDNIQLELQKLKGKKLFAFAGIADSEFFFNSLTEAGLSLGGRLPLSDHTDYDRSLVTKISVLAKDCDGLVTTEKDAVKLATGMFELPCYQVPMSIEIADKKNFLQAVNRRIWSK